VKLQKAKFSFSTKDKYVTFEISVKVSADFRFFYSTAELPDQLRKLDRAPSTPREYFDSFHELQSSINSLTEEFEISLIEETKTRVILYAIETEAVHGKRIDIKFYVCQKVEIGSLKGSSSIRYYKEEKQSSRYYSSTNLTEFNTYQIFDDKYLEMAWSVERENWFKEMETSIEKLAHQLRQGFGKTPELLARKIDQGAKLLLAGGEK
jgi:hypothetical protein